MFNVGLRLETLKNQWVLNNKKRALNTAGEFCCMWQNVYMAQKARITCTAWHKDILETPVKNISKPSTELTKRPTKDQERHETKKAKYFLLKNADHTQWFRYLTELSCKVSKIWQTNLLSCENVWETTASTNAGSISFLKQNNLSVYIVSGFNTEGIKDLKCVRY